MTLTVVYALSLAFCGTTWAIIGGEPAPPGRWPWMAALLHGPRRSAANAEWCGAMLIAPRRALTAGHCAIGTRTRRLHVLVGRTRLTSHRGRRLAVTGIAVFPGFVSQRRLGLDAAVLTLAHDSGVLPVRLAGASDRAAWPPGTPAWTMGWGQINARKSPGGSIYYADRLRELQVAIVSDEACELAYGVGIPGLTYRSRSIVCAGAPHSDAGACFGDSGGPLVVQSPTGWLAVGIDQAADSCAHRRYPEMYTRIDALRGFPLRRHVTLQPDPVRRPRIRGRLVPGTLLHCTHGRWRGSRARFQVQWLRRGKRRTVGAGVTHRVSAVDARRGIACAVIGRNAGGFNRSVSAPLTPH